MADYLCANLFLKWYIACPQLFLPLSSVPAFAVMYICICLPHTVPDVMSSSIRSMTSAALPYPMTSVGSIAVRLTGNVTPGSASRSEKLPIAGRSSMPNGSSATMSSQLPPTTGGGSPSESGTGTVIGVVVAVVIILLVGLVFLAAILIVWRVRSKERKIFTGKRSDQVLHLLSVAVTHKCIMSMLHIHVKVYFSNFAATYIVHHDIRT